MRKIETQDEVEKQTRKRQWGMSLFLVLIMLGSIAGYAAYEFGGRTSDGSSSVINFKGLKFELINNYWSTDINGKKYYFSYSPTQLSNLNFNISTIENYNLQPLYISSENGLAQQELTRNMYNIAATVQLACQKDSNCSDDSLPVKDCSSNFIIIKEGNESIKQVDNCVYISGSFDKLPLLTDEVVYRILKIV